MRLFLVLHLQIKMGYAPTKCTRFIKIVSDMFYDLLVRISSQCFSINKTSYGGTLVIEFFEYEGSNSFSVYTCPSSSFKYALHAFLKPVINLKNVGKNDCLSMIIAVHLQNKTPFR